MTERDPSDGWIYIAQISIPADLEPTFERLYEEEHVPALLDVPGVRGCRRYKLEWSDDDNMPTYLAIYEVDDPDLPRSDAWKAASNAGEWPHLVRPRMTVRRHGMFRSVG